MLSLYPVLRAFFFRLEPERAHDMALASARFISRRRWLANFLHDWIARPASRPVEAMGLTFPHPIGLAAGLDKNAVAPLAWQAFGFGFAELGTVTPVGQPGNPKPRMFRLVDRQALVNRMGFNNDGVEAMAARLAEMERRKLRPAIPLGISVGKNKATPNENAGDDYARAAQAVAPFADFLTINISSPNTKDLRDLQSPAASADLLRRVRDVSAGKPVLLKLAPEIAGDPLDRIIESAMNVGAAGVICTNTKKVGAEQNLPEGGLSGKPIFEASLERVRQARKTLGPGPVVIGCGGVDDASSAQAMLQAGATLVQIYSALVYRGPFLPAIISRGLKA